VQLLFQINPILISQQCAKLVSPTFNILNPSFTPVPPVFYDIFAVEQEKLYTKVYYFGSGTDPEEASGRITGIERNNLNEEYMHFDIGDRAHIDRIVTINGKPGPTYDEYDRYALACLDCSGGMYEDVAVRKAIYTASMLTF
jgi:hypothetical protein